MVSTTAHGRLTRLVAPLLALMVVVGVAPAAAASLSSDLSEVKDRIDDLKDRVGDSEDERTELANEVLSIAEELDAAASRLEGAEQRLEATETELRSTRSQVEDLVDRIGERQEAIASMRSQMDALRERARTRAVELYMQGDTSDTLDFFGIGDVGLVSVGLIYAERVQEVVDRDIALFAALSAREGEQVARLETESRALEARAAELEAQRMERARAADAVAAETEAVQARLDAQQEALDEMDHAISHIEGEIAALAREQRRIEQQIEYEQALAGRPPDGLLRPVPGGVSSGFGYRIHPILGDRRLHTGWDMNGGCGQPIRAAEAGRVFVNAWQGGYGLTVMIDHGGGMSTLYAHQTRTAVSYGQRVQLGDVIGYVGTTGLSTGCHLHFEVRLAGRPVDPADYL
ncbi:MAG: peptidoglycan DD-metalloendopeptidase family protein [Acidimicrobiia bacterium]|nr:peptidoglycan DD-metalloendopeptidase family protein [Acidimicrobiia bacterium]